MKLSCIILILFLTASCSSDRAKGPNWNEDTYLLCGASDEGEAISVNELKTSDLYGFWLNCPGYVYTGIDSLDYEVCEFDESGNFYVYKNHTFYEKDVKPNVSDSFLLEEQDLTILSSKINVRIIGHKGNRIIYKNENGSEISMRRLICTPYYCSEDEKENTEFSIENCREGEWQ